VAEEDQLEGIAKVIMTRCSPEVRVYSDEIYENIVFEGRKHVSIASVPGMASRTIISSGMSKSFAWGGAFYLFPNISGLCERLGVFEAYRNLPETIQTATTPATLFQMFSLYEHQVAVMDRRSFGAIGSEDLHYLRLSIAADLDTLKEGVRRIAAAGEDVYGFRRFVEKGENLY
jgi:aspartate/methionine/tyrosine aminotransferase